MKYTKVYCGIFLTIISVVLFISSLFLPAFTTSGESGPDIISGVDAAILGPIIGIVSLFAPGGFFYGILIFGTWLVNPLFVNLVVRKFDRKRTSWKLIYGVNLLALSFALLGPLCDEKMKFKEGYLVWLCSIMLISYSFCFPNPVKAKISPKIRERENKIIRYKPLPSADIRGMQKLRRR
ncbi:MAG: hypothetical protein NVV82_08445 [Sporocytophaga sp.]|nr:hypothetical protein [Sporocytophaga sp.]